MNKASTCPRCNGRGWVQEYLLTGRLDPALGIGLGSGALPDTFIGEEHLVRCLACKKQTPRPTSRLGLAVVNSGKLAGFERFGPDALERRLIASDPDCQEVVDR
jgi:hypothetical protein